MVSISEVSRDSEHGATRPGQPEPGTVSNRRKVSWDVHRPCTLIRGRIPRCDKLQPVIIPSSLSVRNGCCALILLISAACPAQSTAQQPPAQQPPAQQPPPFKPAQSGMSGIAGGLGAPAQYDEQHNPITKGGFVKPGEAPVVFDDVTRAAGLSGWTHKMGVPQKNFIVETNGSGVCLIDYNN